MARVPAHTFADAPEKTHEELKVLEKKFGKVLNIHGEMAHSPVVLKAHLALEQAIEDHGTFDARTREAIALVVANVDECSYCQSAHTMGAKVAGFTEDQTVAIRSGQIDSDPKLASLLTLVREALGNVGNVSDATWQNALDAGWSDTELTEVSVHIVANLFTNHFNHLVQTDLDVPAAPGL